KLTNPDSSVSIVTGYRLNNSGVGVQVLVESRIFSSHTVQTGSGVHPASYPVGTGKCLPCTGVHNWVEKRGKRFADGEEVETKVRKWLRQQSRDHW
ncbi:hypothetical protein B7P43_G06277, partial [Cryptotermes secundus]